MRHKEFLLLVWINLKTFKFETTKKKQIQEFATGHESVNKKNNHLVYTNHAMIHFIQRDEWVEIKRLTNWNNISIYA